MQRIVSLCTSKNRTETRCNRYRIRFETKKARAVQPSYTSPYIRKVQHGKSRPNSCSKHHLQQTTAILIALVGQEIQRGGDPQTPPWHRHKVLPFEPLDTGNDVVLWDVGGIEQRRGAIGGRRPGVIDDAGEARGVCGATDMCYNMPAAKTSRRPQQQRGRMMSKAKCAACRRVNENAYAALHSSVGSWGMLEQFAEVKSDDDGRFELQRPATTLKTEGAFVQVGSSG